MPADRIENCETAAESLRNAANKLSEVDADPPFGIGTLRRWADECDELATPDGPFVRAYDGHTAKFAPVDEAVIETKSESSSYPIKVSTEDGVLYTDDGSVYHTKDHWNTREIELVDELPDA